MDIKARVPLTIMVRLCITHCFVCIFLKRGHALAFSIPMEQSAFPSLTSALIILPICLQTDIYTGNSAVYFLSYRTRLRCMV